MGLNRSRMLHEYIRTSRAKVTNFFQSGPEHFPTVELANSL